VRRVSRPHVSRDPFRPKALHQSSRGPHSTYPSVTRTAIGRRRRRTLVARSAFLAFMRRSPRLNGPVTGAHPPCIRPISRGKVPPDDALPPSRLLSSEISDNRLCRAWNSTAHQELAARRYPPTTPAPPCASWLALTQTQPVAPSGPENCGEDENLPEVSSRVSHQPPIGRQRSRCIRCHSWSGFLPTSSFSAILANPQLRALPDCRRSPRRSKDSASVIGSPLRRYPARPVASPALTDIRCCPLAVCSGRGAPSTWALPNLGNLYTPHT